MDIRYDIVKINVVIFKNNSIFFLAERRYCVSKIFKKKTLFFIDILFDFCIFVLININSFDYEESVFFADCQFVDIIGYGTGEL